MPSKILFIDHDDGRSGATVSMEYIIDEFARNGYQIFVLTPKNGKAAKVFLNAGATTIYFGTTKFNILRLSTHASTKISFLSLKGLRWLVNNAAKFILGYVVVSRAIRKIHPDLVYVNEHVIVQSLVAAFFHRIPSVIHIRSQITTSGHGVPRFILSCLVLKCSRKVFPITIVEAEQLRPGRRDFDKIQVIGEFAPNAKLYSRPNLELRLSFGLSTTNTIVTLLGGFARIKGTLDFVRAALHICSTRKDVVFVIAGPNMSETISEERSYYEDCVHVIRSLPSDSNVMVLGEIDNPLDLISCSDIIVSPSTFSHFSRPVIEAWAFGKPVIAAHSVHMNNLVNERKDGMLFQSGNESDLTNCLTILLDDRKLRGRLGEAGKKRVESEFNAARNTETIFRLCNILVSAKNSS